MPDLVAEGRGLVAGELADVRLWLDFGQRSDESDVAVDAITRNAIERSEPDFSTTFAMGA